MNICSDRQDACIVGVSGVVCPHARPHDKIENCSHTRFYCVIFPGKQHRCRKFKPVKSDFEVFAKIDTFIVHGFVEDRELLRLMVKYGTTARGYREDRIRVSLPKYHNLFEAFVAGMN